MIKSRKRKPTHYLPPEVVTQVLARLPVKSLLRFRCVCKTWCSIIDDPHFTPMHFHLFKNNRDRTHLLSTESLGRRGRGGSIFAMRRIETLRKTAQLYKTTKSWKLLGCCNGLLMISTDYRGTQLRLWNPCIRKSLLLPPCPLYKHATRVQYVLGFAPSTNDYKVVCFMDLRSSGKELCTAVYRVGDEVWDTNIHSGVGVPRNGFWGSSAVVFFRGAAYWVVHDPYGQAKFKAYEETHVASYDFDAEKLSYLELPDAMDSPTTYQPARSLFILKDCLAVFSASSERRCVWVLTKDGGHESWILWFTDETFQDHFQVGDHRDDKVFYIGNIGTSFLFGKRFWNIATQQMHELGKSMSRDYTLDIYFESLALHKGGNGLTLIDFPSEE